jgi:hypothetical protein
MTMTFIVHRSYIGSSVYVLLLTLSFRSVPFRFPGPGTATAASVALDAPDAIPSERAHKGRDPSTEATQPASNEAHEESSSTAQTDLESPSNEVTSFSNAPVIERHQNEVRQSRERADLNVEPSSSVELEVATANRDARPSSVRSASRSRTDENDRPLTGRSMSSSVEVADSLSAISFSGDRGGRDHEQTPRSSRREMREDLSRSPSRESSRLPSARRNNPLSASEPSGKRLHGSSTPANSRPPSSRSVQQSTPRLHARVSGQDPYRSSYDASMTQAEHLLGRTPSGQVLLGSNPSGENQPPRGTHRRSRSVENDDARRSSTEREGYVRSTSPGPLGEGRVNTRRQEKQGEGDEVAAVKKSYRKG